MKYFGIITLLFLATIGFSQKEDQILTINPVGHKGTIRAMCIDNKKNIITAGYDKVIKIWNSEEGFLEREIYGQIGDGNEGQIYDMAISPNNKYLAIGGWLGSTMGTEAVGDIRLIDYKTGEMKRLLKAHAEPIKDLIFLSDYYLLSTDGGGYVLIWEVKSGDYWQFKNIDQDITDIAVLGSNFVTCHASGMIYEWSIEDLEKPVRSYNKLIKEEMPLTKLTVSPDGQLIVLASYTDVIVLNSKFKEECRFWNGEDDITNLAFSPDGTKLLVTSSSIYIKKNKMKVYQILDGLAYSYKTYQKHENLVLCGDWIDNKTCVTAGGSDNEIVLWELDDKRKFPVEKQYIAGVGSIIYAASMMGNTLAFTRTWSQNFGFSKKDLVFDFVTRSVSPLESDSLYSVPVREMGEYTLEHKRTAVDRETLILKKNGMTYATMSRDETNGTLHNVSTFVNGMIVSGGGYGFIQVYDLKGKVLGHLIGHEGDVWGLSISSDGRYLVSCSNDQMIKIWRTEDIGKDLVYPVVSVFISKTNEWVIWNNDGYFTSSRKGASYVGYHINQGKDKAAKFYPFEQFDLKFNRPDIIMKDLDIVDESIIGLYRSAYEKRIKRMGISEDDLSAELNVPTVQISSKKKEGSKLLLTVKAGDEQVFLNRLNVFINDVPIYGRKGIDLTSRNAKELSYDLELDLMNGRNKVQISVLNQNGVESLKETVYINHVDEHKPDLYIMAIGVSSYQDSTFNLDYAAKDAEDIKELFASSQLYGQIHSEVLLNENVTRKNILSAKDFFKPAGTNDVVILFIAGHGVLDANLEYYFCTHDIDFQDPSKNGIAYEKLESLFDGINALKKLLIMDTCHSGEVDKDDIEEIAAVDTELGDISFRTTDATTVLTERQGLKQTNEAVKEMFNDLRRGTGATVLSSAGGVEFAMESEEWKNGLFTYCLLKGLKQGEADLNQDGEIYLSELQEFVRGEVLNLSKGKQQPTSRFENISLDYRIW